MKKIILSLLVALMATTGAWAEGDAPEVKPFTVPSTWQNSGDAYTADDLPSDFVACSDDEAAAWAASCTEGSAVLIYSINNVYIKAPKGSAKSSYNKEELFGTQNAGSKIYYTVASAATTVTVTEVAENQWQFTMPAYDVEVNTELWYRLSQTEDNSAYQTKTNVFLERTLQAGGWNTFCAPFAISNPASVFGEGVQVKAFIGSSLSGGTLTLSFEDAASIAAATPYLIKLPGESNVDLTADGKEFEGVTQNWTPVDVNPDEGMATFKAVLVPTELTEGDKSVLFVTGGNALTYPNNTGNINAFRAYFQLSESLEARAFRMSFEEDADAIRTIDNGQLTIDNENDAWYDLSGRKMVNGKSSNGKLPKGIYIHNGRKEVMK